MRGALLALALSMLGMVAFSQPAKPSLRGRHATEALSCKDCHKTTEPVARPPAEACDRCHTYAELATATAKVDPNPHQSHQGEVRCTLCHRVHQPSMLVCNECHEFELKVP